MKPVRSVSILPLAAFLCALFTATPTGVAQPAEEGDVAEPALEADSADAVGEVATVEPAPGRTSDLVLSLLEDNELREGDRANAAVNVLGNLRVDGDVRWNVVSVLGQSEINGEVGENAVTILGRTTFTGRVDDNKVVVLGRAYVDGTVDGDLVAVLSKVEFGPNAVINGETTIIGGSPVIDPAARMNGGYHPVLTRFPALDWLAEYIKRGPLLVRPFPPDIPWVWKVAGALLLLNFIVAFLFPKAVEAGDRALRTKLLRSFLLGSVIYILWIPLLLLLTSTVVGVLAIPFLLVAFVVAAFFGKVIVCHTFGAHLAAKLGVRTPVGPLFAVLLGSAVIALVYMVPVLGGLVWLFLRPVAIGAVTFALVETLFADRMAHQRQRTAAVPATAPAPGPAPAASSDAPTEPPVIGSATTAGLNSLEIAALPRVGFWPRLGATLLDFLLIVVIAALFGSAFGYGVRTWLLLWFVYHVGMWAWRGTTLGGLIFGLRVTREDGRPVEFTSALVRSIASLVSFIPLGLGFFWASWSESRQSWHDFIAGTVVVKMPRITPLVA